MLCGYFHIILTDQQMTVVQEKQENNRKKW